MAGGLNPETQLSSKCDKYNRRYTSVQRYDDQSEMVSPACAKIL
jgi:hypothetical protein